MDGHVACVAVAGRFARLNPGAQAPLSAFPALATLRRPHPRTAALVDHPQRLPARTRLVAAVAALMLAVPVALATRLTPDARGWGTHEQLGLAPCWFRQWSGRACPTCGMTTAWAYAVRGDALAAVESNAGGAVLLVATVGAAAWLVAVAATGRPLGGRPPLRWAVSAATAWLVVTLADWARRLAGG